MTVEFTIKSTKTTVRKGISLRKAEVLSLNYDGTVGIFNVIGDVYDKDIVLISPFVSIMPLRICLEGVNIVALRGNRISRILMEHFEEKFGKAAIPRKRVFSKEEASVLTGVPPEDIMFFLWPKKRKNRYTLTVDHEKYFGSGRGKTIRSTNS